MPGRRPPPWWPLIRGWPAILPWLPRSPRCSTRSRPNSWRRREAVSRVIAGAARGRRLAVPPGRLTRPTSDRAREGLFSTLIAIRGPLDGGRVLDLYAGSGAVGLEALSRGADRVLFVEADAGAARVIRSNLAAVGLPGGHLVTGRVERVLARGLAGPGRGWGGGGGGGGGGGVPAPRGGGGGGGGAARGGAGAPPPGTRAGRA